MPSAPSKTWTFTKSNYDHTDLAFFIEWPDFNLMVFGRETAPTTGTRHLQGYFILKDSARFSYLKATLPEGTHFEAARKCELANIRYCTKSRNYTIIDRRHGRDGIPRPVTELRDSPLARGSRDSRNSDSRVDELAERLQPRLRLNIFRR